MNRTYLLWLALLFNGLAAAQSSHSIARVWNEVLLQAIRNDEARPVVHARNLFHASAGMYDCWSVIQQSGTPFFLGREANGVDFRYSVTELPAFPDPTAATEEAITYFNYHFLRHRFRLSPGRDSTYALIARTINTLGYPIPSDNETGDMVSTPRNLGTFVANRIIGYGLNDGSNEDIDHGNRHYRPANGHHQVGTFGLRSVADPDRWQPLGFDIFISQSGIMQEGVIPDFIGPEWGRVTPFALPNSALSIKYKPNNTNPWWVYHDPGDPPYFRDAYLNGQTTSWFHWNFELVVKWGAHLDPSDGVVWDISPASIGNIGVENYPRRWEDYPLFYDEFEGGDPSKGHRLNPRTGQPYTPQLVPRADYARVLAEFWADGPKSETPPGHWFVIMNEAVLDHPDFTFKFKGEGSSLPRLEFDIKAYFLLGGAMHDAAISAWGVKGYYDYVRPITAIRYLTAIGQRSDQNSGLPNFNPFGINLYPGIIENFTNPADVDDGRLNGNIKFRQWRGNRYIEESGTAAAGVGWINGLWWEPYQRATFVTPAFAGYVSGHSTFSSAAAETLERLTGDPFFPGGIAEFFAPANEFLEFEQGPSVDVYLQWATYRDASDQTSLSRIWGGIHPPVDDIPGRFMGLAIGKDAFALAERLFQGVDVFCAAPTEGSSPLRPQLAKNPIRQGEALRFSLACGADENPEVVVYDILGREMAATRVNFREGAFATHTWPKGLYFLRLRNGEKGAVSSAQLF